MANEEVKLNEVYNCLSREERAEARTLISECQGDIKRLEGYDKSKLQKLIDSGNERRQWGFSVFGAGTPIVDRLVNLGLRTRATAARVTLTDILEFKRIYYDPEKLEVKDRIKLWLFALAEEVYKKGKSSWITNEEESAQVRSLYEETFKKFDLYLAKLE